MRRVYTITGDERGIRLLCPDCPDDVEGGMACVRVWEYVTSFGDVADASEAHDLTHRWDMPEEVDA